MYSYFKILRGLNGGVTITDQMYNVIPGAMPNQVPCRIFPDTEHSMFFDNAQQLPDRIDRDLDIL